MQPHNHMYVKLKGETYDYDGTYDCLICSESVRGKPALSCKVLN